LNVSYSILTHNETDVLVDLLEFLGANKKEQDEIIVLDDYSNDKTLGILSEYREKYGVAWEQRKLNKNFAVTGFKNFSHFPEDERFAIRHHKNIENQEKQNSFYGDIIRG
jgi:glycosyltransferase involved in cell wall biosynthesis